MVQLVPLSLQVLAEGLLERWAHFGHGADVTATGNVRAEERGRETKRGETNELTRSAPAV